MRNASRLLFTAAAALAAHCPHSPYGFNTPPAQPPPRTQVFFDSGAVLRVEFRDGKVVTGHLVESFVAGGERLVLCEESRSPCERHIPLATIQELRFPYSGLSIGVDAGWRLGVLLAAAKDDENEILMGAGMLAGAVVGGAIGSQVTRWITIAERGLADSLAWIPQDPFLVPPPWRHEFAIGCRVGSGVGDSLPAGEMVGIAAWTHGKFHTDIKRAWVIDRRTSRMRHVPTAGVRCLRASWPSPGPAALRDMEAVALNFTPSPGKARIYVYQEYRVSVADDSINFNVAIEGRAAGETGNGEYVMVEVEPGTHRVTVQEGPDHALSVHAAADSVYFVKVSHKRTRKGPRFGGIEVMDAVKGRRMILEAQLAPLEISDAVTVEKRPGGWLLHNSAPVRLYVLMAEGGAADLIEWTPEVGEGGLQIPPLSSVRIPHSYMVGHGRGGPRAVVFWWQAVEHPDGTLGADRVRRLVVDLE